MILIPLCTALYSNVYMVIEVTWPSPLIFRAYVYSVARECDNGRVDPKVLLLSDYFFLRQS